MVSFWNRHHVVAFSLRVAVVSPVTETVLENNLIKPKKIVLKGVPLDLKQIHLDIYAVGTEQDHIVPWKSAWRISQLASGKVRFVLGGSGHIAGIINPPSKGREYWTNEKPVKTADEWLENAMQHKGSWWADWLEWLSGKVRHRWFI